MFWNRFRYALLVMGFLCLASICSNYIIINFTFICMESDDSGNVHIGNKTVNRYNYSPAQKTVIPLAAYLGLPYLLVSRFVQGLAYAADFAAIGIICVRWAPLSQIGLFISILTTFTQISSIVTNPLSGWLCHSSLGWRSAFYVHAAFGLFMFLLWIMFYRDDPQLHSCVSEKELSKIHKDKTRAHIERDSFVPYKEIITNKVILIIWFNAFTEMTTAILLLVYAPTYFHKVLGYDIPTTGKFGNQSKSPRRAIQNVVFQLNFSEWSKTGVTLFTLVITCMGFNPGGFYKCGTLCSRQYAHFVLAAIQFMKCVAMFVAPGTVALLVQDESRYNQWRYVYWINGILLIIANFTFLPIATDQPASFTLITRATKEEQNRKKFSYSKKSNGKVSKEDCEQCDLRL
ncbi:unnamed protein product [Cylicocyclus nassatus]|uniref:Major facilitator superfamily (MFS) profile domain-containing protein n=1 Tax=Cylicocyclus nassatus TaxID=53992 RepID=A0AA36HCT6_CYLNA|nr:unnamed protein product [Cylicocyclus nassatus]